jgi:hypothetical protein
MDFFIMGAVNIMLFILNMWIMKRIIRMKDELEDWHRQLKEIANQVNEIMDTADMIQHNNLTKTEQGVGE